LKLAIRQSAPPFPTDRNAPANLGAALYLRSTRSICEVKKAGCNGETKKALFVYNTAGRSFEDLIFERDALGIVIFEYRSEKQCQGEPEAYASPQRSGGVMAATAIDRIVDAYVRLNNSRGAPRSQNASSKIGRRS
jgi:hypothetical protein